MQTPARPAQSVGYSASVELFLHVGEKTLRPTHVSEREIIFATPPDLHAGHADVEVIVDGLTSTRAVQILPHPAGATRLPIAAGSVSRVREVDHQVINAGGVFSTSSIR